MSLRLRIHNGAGWVDANLRRFVDGAWADLGGGNVTPPDADLPLIAQQIKAGIPETFAYSYDIGPGQTYATISAALSAASANNNTIVPNSNGQTTPYRRHKFRIWPGDYYEHTLGFPTHAAIIGMGASPDEVRIWHDQGVPGNEGKDWVTGAAVGGTLVITTGRSLYVNNLRLDHVNPDPEHHSMRDAGYGGNIGQRGYQRRTVIFDNVHMSSDPLGMSGKAAADLTPTGVDLIFYRVHFDTPGQPQAVNGISNYKAMPSGVKSRIFYYDCSVTAGYDWYEDPTLPYNGRYSNGLVPGQIPLGFPDFAATAGDEVWWVEGPNSVWNFGHSTKYDEPYRASIAVVKNQGGTKTPTNHNGSFHIDPALPKATGATAGLLVKTPTGDLVDPTSPVTAAGGVVDRVIPTNLPISITDGMSADEATFYGPNPATSPAPARITAISPTGSVTLTAGRIYWLRIPMPASMIIASAIGIDTTGSGSVAVAHAFEQEGLGKPYTTAANQMTRSNQTTTGTKDITLAKRWYFPGHNAVWVALACTDAITAQGRTKTAGDGVTVWYADGYTGSTIPDHTAQVLPDGAAYPTLSVVNALT